jgi:hypothetical protein
VSPNPADPTRVIAHVAYGEDVATGGGAIFYRRGVQNTTGRFFWDPPVKVSADLNASPWAKSIAADGNGGVHIAFSAWDSVTRNDEVYYSRSDDHGVTFPEIATLVASPAYETSIGVDGNGTPYLSYIWYPNTYFSRRLADGTWTVPVPVNGPDGGYYSSIAVFDSSHIYVGYRVNRRVVVAATSDGGTTWTEYPVPADGRWAQDPCITVDSQNRVHAAWYCGGDICYSRSKNNLTQWIDPAVAAPWGDYPNIATDDNDAINIMYMGGFDGDAAYFTKEQ